MSNDCTRIHQPSTADGLGKVGGLQFLAINGHTFAFVKMICTKPKVDLAHSGLDRPKNLMKQDSGICVASGRFWDIRNQLPGSRSDWNT